jgi:hypothetical protein
MAFETVIFTAKNALSSYSTNLVSMQQNHEASDYIQKAPSHAEEQ